MLDDWRACPPEPWGDSWDASILASESVDGKPVMRLQGALQAFCESSATPHVLRLGFCH